MDGSAHLHFSLNVNDFAVPEACGGRNARGSPERIIAHRHDDQAVDLTGGFTFSVDHNCPVDNHLLKPLFRAIGSVYLLIYSLLDVCCADQKKLSIRFLDVVDLIREAAFYAARRTREAEDLSLIHISEPT